MNISDLPAGARVHMVGVGGAGVSGLALIMAGLGYRVSGSDMNPGPMAERLRSVGITVHDGHRAANADGADLVVASAAIPEDNPELVAARKRGTPVLSRAQMLGRLMTGSRGIAVSGTHGKTTTTSMLAVVLEAAGLDPTILIGGDLDQIGGNAKLGGDLFLTEACEAFNSFLELAPRIAVVTNIEADHLDCHGSLDGVIAGFRKFLSRIEEGGLAVLCADCPNVRAVIPSVRARALTYGLEEGADCRGIEVDVSTCEPSFGVMLAGRDLGRFTLRSPGEHNVRNALATIAVAVELGVEPETARAALAEFRGAGRRFEILGTARGITVVDDYAHHPTEIRATLAAARSCSSRVVAVFQPHLYSRTRLLAADFADALRAADEVIVTEIYPAREEPVPGVSGALISDLLPTARFIPDKGRLAEEIVPHLRDGDMLLVMGAGDIRCAAEEALSMLGAVSLAKEVAPRTKET